MLDTIRLDSPGVYVDTLKTPLGCDSIVNVTLHSDTVDASSSYVGYNLKANNPNAQYQWYKCGTWFKVNGETNQIYSPTDNDWYACIVRVGKCKDTTACMSIALVGTQEHGVEQNDIKVYPNPSLNGEFELEWNETNTVLYHVTNSRGEVIRKGELNGTLNLEDQPSGIYVLHLKMEDQLRVVKLIKL